MNAEPTADQERLIEAYLNETISKADFATFEKQLQASPEFRAELRRYLALDSNLRESMTASQSSTDWTSEEAPATVSPTSKSPAVLWWPIAAAAAAAFILGISIMTWIVKSKPVEQIAQIDQPPPKTELKASGFAVVHHLRTDATINTPSSHNEGDTLTEGIFMLPSGAAELHFFCGARMIVEGPAEIEIKSGWEAICRDGNLRIQVPPAARGFKVTTPGSEIIDLGTEFGLEVRNGNATVEVLDGEIAVNHGTEKKQLLTSGQRRFLPNGGASETPTGKRLTVPDPDAVAGQFNAQRKESFQRWRTFSQAFREDQRLIAYYDFQPSNEVGIIPNIAHKGDPELRGAVIMAEPVSGRWGAHKGAIDFKRPGSRVRIHAAGEFSAFSFACWVRIDSLSHRFNALFMADSYETGEPHWQIHEDGRLMLSVMVDDTDIKDPNTNRQTGRHLIYYSPKIWDETKSGEWIHLASTYDPTNRVVTHYANGNQISTARIKDKFFINTLRIGNGEIGNWGQPFKRHDAEFAIRNLNGRIDELAILDASLSAEEIKALYSAGR